MTYMEYKGYLGTIKPQLDDNTLYGRLAFIRDLVTCEAASLRKEFETSVNDYQDFYREQGEESDKPRKGAFDVRTGLELHRVAEANIPSR